MTVIALLVAGVVVVYAWIGLGAALGEWAQGALQRDCSAPRSAFVGTFLFMVVTNLLVFIPVVGGWAAFLTGFGLREFDPSYDFGPPQASQA